MASRRLIRWLAGTILLLVAWASGHAQQQPGPDPLDLVRRAARNEVHATENQSRFFMYKDHTQYKNHSITKEMLETPQGGLSRMLAINGKPLAAEQRAKEDQKLTKFANDPEARRKKEESSKEEDKREEVILTSLPDAFLYTYAGSERGPDGDELVHLKFRPNPKFEPPNHETRVYVGMEGDLVIDTKAMRIAKIDGTLFKDVDFGWGILGKLYKGGRFIIEQRDVGSGHWETTRETLQFNGKILLFKSLTIDSTETATDFRPVPANITTAQALDLLRKSADTVAENGGGAKETPNSHK